MSGRSIMLAAGGTGGHLFPAMALAQELTRRGWTVDLITDMRGDRYGSDFPARAVHRVPAATLAARTPLAAGRLLVTLARGVAAARTILRRERPAAVAGFGGYPTFPPLIAARMSSIPSVIHEQNAVMGRANRVLQKLATGIALSFEKTRYAPPADGAHVWFTGNPVRDAVISAGKRAYERPGDSGPFRLVVFGGSQGARYFSETVPPALERLEPAARQRLRVVQQCRSEDLGEVREAYDRIGIEAELAPFFPDLPARLAASHLVIARAGASTVAELAVLGRPAILVPYVYALDNDQLENATRLQEAGGAWCLPQAALTPQTLSERVQALIAEPERLADAAAAARSCGRPDAVSLLADTVEMLAREGRRKG